METVDESDPMTAGLVVKKPCWKTTEKSSCRDGPFSDHSRTDRISTMQFPVDRAPRLRSGDQEQTLSATGWAKLGLISESTVRCACIQGNAAGITTLEQVERGFMSIPSGLLAPAVMVLVNSDSLTASSPVARRQPGLAIGRDAIDGEKRGEFGVPAADSGTGWDRCWPLSGTGGHGVCVLSGNSGSPHRIHGGSSSTSPDMSS
ncbi:hypothetical protein PVAR5_2255 [Paecilomyces variotii No. 5]|uniref:Uncharacterized protein n=1 Tax=Byssochlamys spectabilis (strain No. 5 / NBRC 109023) TaxID=1356009 RepID=V5FYE8_BYSSN|nr:hypothetical protein PVAR5_2255 [Paecilomyces variotii No. 5]